MFFCDYPIFNGEEELPIYLVNMGQHHCQDHIIRTEGYPYHQILYSTKGSGTIHFGNHSYKLSPYTAVYIQADQPHEYYPNEDIWDVHWVVPSGYACENILKHFGFTESKVYYLDEINMLELIFRKMHDAIRSDSVYGNYKASGYLYDFIIEFNRQTSVNNVTYSPNTALMKTLDYINCNYSSALTMDDLCSVSGVSKQHLCTLFKKNLSNRPMEYIAKRRIQAAKELLISTYKSVEEISDETGFCTSSYFCRLFKRYEGMTPSQFRNT